MFACPELELLIVQTQQKKNPVPGCLYTLQLCKLHSVLQQNLSFELKNNNF